MSDPRIPILDLRPQIETHWDAFNAAFQRVLRSGHFILGPEEKAFEQECAEFLGVGHAIGVNSGTDALFIALRALQIGPGDEVITSPFTFFATAEAISHVGATPVFVDVDEDTFNLDPLLTERAITARTKAIIPVHLFGRPCEMDRISALGEAHDLAIVEDCAQSFGAHWRTTRCGSIGEFGCFSFFPTKNLNAFGDGGLVTTNDAHLASAARMLRAHGSRKKYYNEMVGYNSRLDEVHAAILRVKLRHLDSWNAARRAAAERYDALLAGIERVTRPALSPGHVFHQYTIRLQGVDRSACIARMSDAGIGTMVYYPVPCHKLPLYRESHAATSCPVAEQLAREVLSLPIWPEIAPEVQGTVVTSLRHAIG